MLVVEAPKVKRCIFLMAAWRTCFCSNNICLDIVSLELWNTRVEVLLEPVCFVYNLTVIGAPHGPIFV